MEDDELFFEIFDRGNYIRVSPLKYVYPDSEEWDSAWIDVKIEVKAGAFTAKYKAGLRTSDFKILKEYFGYIYSHLDGEFKFEDIEHHFELNLKGDGIGHFEIYCTVSDEPGYMESSLSFYLSIDQTQIMPIVWQLDEILNRFPALK